MIIINNAKTLKITGVLGGVALAGVLGLSTFATSRADAPVDRNVPVKSGGKVIQAPATIAADLSKDVTEELNEFIKSTPDGSTIVFPQDAKYLIEGTVLVENKTGLTFDGQGALFQSKDSLPDYIKGKDHAEHRRWGRVRERAHWRIKNSRDITVRNLEVFGPHQDAGRGGVYKASREAQHAFDVFGVKGLTIEKVKLHDLWGDGVYLSGDSERIIIRDSNIQATGRQGIAVAVGRDILIENNDITDSRRGLIDIEPYGKKWQSGDIRIIGNRFGDSRLLALPMGGGGDIGMVLIANNVFKGGNGVPLVYHRSSNPQTVRGPFLFVNNRAAVGGSPAPAFDFGKVNGVFVAGNQMTFPGFRNMTVARLRDTTAGFFGNIFAGAIRVTSTEETTHVVARSDATSRAIAEGNAMPEWLNSVKESRQRSKAAKAGEEMEQMEEEAEPTTWKEISGGYAVQTRLEDGSLAIAVVRSGDIETPRKLSGYGLNTEAKMAWIYVKDGKVLQSYVMDDGQFSFLPGA